ncbi:hypothetical protein Lesp02_50360 [Lentzea sp. NBRC 105346]|uniref:FMN-binding protein n=1 Tax=Lentzea sp. NBRC 105346 TaxID=3032205 RepID=UPI0024A4432B|nr:FMN-binding protein [Lentzea sp. NBRC 105346]GLZ32848.1 hypothetical protein Lesp02_50360 [Lentzea sp. NBRC 105346]
MKRAIPVLVLSAAGLVPVWLFEPGAEEPLTDVAAPVTEAPAQTQAQTQTQAGTPQAANKTVKGKLIKTSEGDVQVQAVFQGTKITDIQVVTAPNTAPTKKALPLLKQSALQAQSAKIDTVSGATATSGGYKQSLQSAIDQAQ